MRKHLTKYFIPHEGNDHQPYFLRDACLSIVVVLAVALTAGSALIEITGIVTKFDYLASILPSVLVLDTNETRVAYGEKELVISDLLVAAAQLKANDMAAKGYFAHVSPDGTSPWFWIQKAGYSYTDAGENLAVNFTDSDEVHNAWMNSPGHRANILREGFTEIGIATASGRYQGRDAIFVVQYFGKPKIVAVEMADTRAPQPVVTSPVVVEAPAVSETAPQVLGEQELTTTVVRPPTNISWYQKMLASPRTMLMWLLGIFAGVVALAIVLKIFIRRHIQYPHLILNGALVLGIILVLMGVSRMMGGLMSGIA